MPAPDRPVHLAILGDKRAINWVLQNQVLAFPEQRYKNIFPTFEPGDRLLMYATRGAFGNPTRDRGRIFASATATKEVRVNKTPIDFRGRELPLELPVRVEKLSRVLTGVDLADMVPHMTSFPKPDRWSVYLRRSVYPLTPEDSVLLDAELSQVAGGLNDHLAGYQEWASIQVVYAGGDR